jgi:hypothetical protein
MISADEQKARDERMTAIRECHSCDPNGWKFGRDGIPVDPAVRCDHGAPIPGPACRDITEPIHAPEATP